MSERRRSGRSIATTVVIVGLMVGGVAAPASAEACSSSGLQPRVLVTDDPGFIETQYCLDGQWRTTSRLQVAPDTKVINEKVWDPRDDRYNLSAAEAFFGIKTRDPYETVGDAKRLLDAATDSSGLIELKVALAESRAQALLHRQATTRSDGCQVRPAAYSALSTRSFGWEPPASIAAADQPSQIDFDFAPGTSAWMRGVVLSAIDQYPAAVAAQDALGRYPTRIVPHDPGSTRPATITFRAAKEDELREDLHATTKVRQYSSWLPGAAHRWVDGSVILSTEIDPSIVGHEIGHVLGLAHLPSSMDFGIMRDTLITPLNWSERLPIGEEGSKAFDECMFLPPVQNLVTTP